MPATLLTYALICYCYDEHYTLTFTPSYTVKAKIAAIKLQLECHYIGMAAIRTSPKSLLSTYLEELFF
jgi:hypothetical protein